MTLAHSRPLTVMLMSVLALALVGCQAPQQAQTPAPQIQIPDEYSISGVVEVEAHVQKWEYKTLKAFNLVQGPFGFPTSGSGDTWFSEDGDTGTLEQLNTLGLDGWELVGIAPSPSEIGAVLIFKRPLE